MSDLGGQCRAVECGGFAGVVSGLCGQGVCQSGSAAEVLEVLEVVRMVGGGWVRFGNVQYSLHVLGGALLLFSREFCFRAAPSRAV
jgi:hypothetical protein